MKKITSFLSQKWNMDDKDIEVLIEGGYRKRMSNDKGPLTWLKISFQKKDIQKKTGKIPLFSNCYFVWGSDYAYKQYVFQRECFNARYAGYEQ